MTATITDLASRRCVAPVAQPLHAPRNALAGDGIKVYHHMLRDEAVSVAELQRALRHTDIVITTDDVGNQILHRRPAPKGAA